jgi:hypothetical protein
MYAWVLPFGKHKGRPLPEVPSDYLSWLLRTRLTARLRAAVRTELLSRPDRQDLPPEPPSVDPFCKNCGSVDLTVSWQPMAGGRRAIRADCQGCGRYVGYLPQTPANVARAGTGEQR